MTNKVRLLGLSSDPALDLARGVDPSVMTINKFGFAPSGMQTAGADIWDRSDATPTQSLWLAPLASRKHAIVSTSTDDDAGSGQGAWTIQVYGLQTWSSPETSEIVILDGQVGVNTDKDYVIIHRMKVVTSGTNGPNVGTISATAATDASVTAVISIGKGQTLMAIYGIPSVQDLYLTKYYGIIAKAQGAVVSAVFELVVNPEPDVNAKTWLVKNHRGLQSTGTSSDIWGFSPYFKIPGPAIVKVRGISSADDVDGAAGFDGYVVSK